MAQEGPGVIVLIGGPDYNAATNVYGGSFSVNNPSQVRYLVYTVEDADAGTVVVGDTQVNLGGFNSKLFELDGTQFKAEHKYLLKVMAVDESGNLIQRTGDNAGQEPSEQFILASKEFTHLPPPAPVFAFKIDSANADYDTDELIMRLTVPGGFRVLKYDGYIIDDTGQQVGVIPGALFTGPELVAPLPEAMEEATEQHEYTLTLRLYTQDDQQAEQIYKIKATPPPPPGFFTRIFSALTQNPLIAVAILLVLSGVVTAIILIGRRPPPSALPEMRPPQDESTRGPRVAVRRNRLHVRVVQSPGASRGAEKTIKDFPCVIGKDKSCAIVIDDPHVSRRHLEITLKDNYFFVTDTSSNGSFINDVQLRKGAATHIPGVVSVRLGDQTILELEAE
jgi:hypothetical protein